MSKQPPSSATADNAHKSGAPKTVASVIVAMLKDAGVDRATCVSGESFLGLLDALERDGGINIVTCRHEGGAALMAVADSKLTGRLGVCMVSRGPGAANAAVGVIASKEDTVPLLLIVGQVEKALLRRDGFQEMDYSKLFNGTAKWTAELTDPERVTDVMSRAIHEACSGTPGPVIVALPEDIQAESVSAAIPAPHRPLRSAPPPDTLSEVEAMLARSSRPLVIAGGELANERGRKALLAAAEAWSVPVLVSFRRLDLFPNAHPLFAGELGFFNHSQHIEAYQGADLILAIGTRLGDLTTQGFTFPRSPEPVQPFVHVHRDPDVIGRNFVPTIGLACEAPIFLDMLAAKAPEKPPARDNWSRALRKMRQEVAHWKGGSARDGVVFGNVVAGLGKHIARDAIIALDAGISAAMIYRHYEFMPPQILLTPITGAMGFGIPAAAAAALRFPDRQVICLIGDGGFLMGGNELAVIAERRLPVVVLLANNSSYGAIRLNLERAYPGRRLATDLFNPDFGMIGAAYGCRVLRIDTEAEIEPTLADAFSRHALTFIEVRTSLEVALKQASASQAVA